MLTLFTASGQFESGLCELLLSGVGVEKVRDRNETLAAVITAIESILSPQLRGSFHSRDCVLAKEVVL